MRRKAPIVALFLAACQGVSSVYLQEKEPIQTYKLSGNYQAIFRCVVNEYTDDLSIEQSQVYSDLGVSEIWVGARQMGQIKYYYYIELIKVSEVSTQIKIRRHGEMAWVNLNQVSSALNSCSNG